MKFKKIYHALTADPKNKWAESFHETVDIDQAEAEDENLRFELTGIKYELIDSVTDTEPVTAPDSQEEEVTEEASAPDVFSDKVVESKAKKQ
jgi:hypothetical protein